MNTTIDTARKTPTDETVSKQMIQNILGLFAICVFLSGFSALIYEVTWQRVLLRVVGGTLPAVTTILCAFMGGLAVGSAIVARLSRRIDSPMKLFSWIELGLGAFGLFFPLLTTQASLSVVLDLVSMFAGALLHLDPVSAYATPGGAILFNTLLTIVICALLAVPTVAMGATFPLCAKSVQLLIAEEKANDKQILNVESTNTSRSITKLYFYNLAGAAVGSVFCAFILLPWVGVADTIRVAAALNLLTSLILLFLHRYILLISKDPSALQEAGGNPHSLAGPQSEKLAEDAGSHGLEENRGLVFLNVSVAIFGAIALGLQVTWIRLFSLLFGSSTYAAATVVALSILGLALGAIASRWMLRRGWSASFGLRFCAAFSSVLLGITLFTVSQLPQMVVNFELYLATWQPPIVSYVLARCLLILAFVLPQATVLGVITPFILGKVNSNSNDAAQSTGMLLIFSTAGSVLGAVLAGCIFVPHTMTVGAIFPFTRTSGIQNTLLLFGLVQVIFALATTSFFALKKSSASDSECRSKFYAPLIIAVCALTMLLLRPTWNPSAMSGGIASVAIPTLQQLAPDQLSRLLSGKSTDLLFYKEGTSTTVTVGSNTDRNVLFLKNDGKTEAALPVDPARPSPASDEPTQVLLGMLPTLISPVTPTTAFLIGFGSGTTAGSMLSSRDIRSLSVAEIESAVYDASGYFDRVNNSPLRQDWIRDGRIIPTVADARNLLALSRDKYNLIVSQPAEPWTTGSADLYSLEFWRLAKSKLQPHGLFCQWLQLYAIDSNKLAIVLRTFTTIFPNTLLFHSPRAGELIMVGFENGEDKLDADILAQRFERADKASLARVGVDTTQDILDLIVGTSKSVKTFCVAKGSSTHDERINTDNNLLTEYLIPTTSFTASDSIDKNLRALGRVTPSEAIKHNSSRQDLTELSYQSGLANFRTGTLDEALRQAQTAAASNAFCSKCHVLHGRILFNQHRYAESVNALNKALEANPNQYRTRMLLGKSYFALAQVDKALDQFNRAAKTEPDSGEPYAAVASVFLLTDDWKSAKPNAEILKKRAPNDQVTRMICFLVAKGEGLDELEAQNSKSLKLDKTDLKGNAEACRRRLHELLTTDDRSDK